MLTLRGVIASDLLGQAWDRKKTENLTRYLQQKVKAQKARAEKVNQRAGQLVNVSAQRPAMRKADRTIDHPQWIRLGLSKLLDRYAL